MFKPVPVGPLPAPEPTDATNRADDRFLWWRHERIHRSWMRDPAAYAAAAAERDELERRWVADRVAPSDAWAMAAAWEERTGRVVPGTDTVLPADLVLLAMGFTGAREEGLLASLGVRTTARGTVEHDGSWATSVPGVFTAGDCARGQSLIVWAIAEGRSCAAAVDAHLMGGTSLPAPVRPGEKPVTV